jgi:hypothetical protein
VIEPRSSRLAATARRALAASSVLLALALLIQAFTAGMAAVTDPGWWATHLAWVRVFQWLVVVLPASAVLADVPLRTKWMSAAPLLLIALQYVLAHRGLDGTFPAGLGLHAVTAMLLFAVTAFIAGSAWRSAD